MKQSSIEFLLSFMESNVTLTPEMKQAFEQAKEIHKQEIMRAYNSSYNVFGLYDDGNEIAQIYYDKFFKRD